MSLVCDVNYLYKDVIMKNFTCVNLPSLLNYSRLSLLCLTFLLSFSIAANPSVTESTVENEKVALISINNANVKTLTSLKGVGKVKAQAIINYRETYGTFTSLNSLANVKGIGEKVLIENKHILTL